MKDERKESVFSRRSFLLYAPLAVGLSQSPLRQTQRDRRPRGTELEGQLRNAFRRVRVEHRLAIFEAEPTLAQISRRHAQDMLRRGFFDHRSPDGEEMAQRVARGHRRLIGLPAENLWSGSRVDATDPEALAERIADGLMRSPGHRENILRPNYTHMDVGAEIQGEEIRVVQLFAEVDAYLKNPLPRRLQAGQPVDLSVQLVASRRDAARFDLFSLENHSLAVEPLALDQPLPPIAPGEYSLRFYFRTFKERQLKIVYGPSFWLE